MSTIKQIFLSLGIALLIIAVALLFRRVKDYEFHFPSTAQSVLKTTAGTYDLDVYVIVASDTDYVREYIRDTFDQEVDNFNASAFTLPSEDGSPVIIWFPDLRDQSIVSHELFHATLSIMKWADISLNDSTEEAFACEVQYLHSRINKYFGNESSTTKRSSRQGN